VIPALQRKR
jgi:hypothetical protein